MCMCQNCFKINTALLCGGAFCTEVLQDSLAVKWTLQKFKTELEQNYVPLDLGKANLCTFPYTHLPTCSNLNLNMQFQLLASHLGWGVVRISAGSLMQIPLWNGSRSYWAQSDWIIENLELHEALAGARCGGCDQKGPAAAGFKFHGKCDGSGHSSKSVCFLKMGAAAFKKFLIINNVIEVFRNEGKRHPIVQISHLAFGAATRTLSLPGWGGQPVLEGKARHLDIYFIHSWKYRKIRWMWATLSPLTDSKNKQGVKASVLYRNNRSSNYPPSAPWSSEEIEHFIPFKLIFISKQHPSGGASIALVFS